MSCLWNWPKELLKHTNQNRQPNLYFFSLEFISSENEAIQQENVSETNNNECC